MRLSLFSPVFRELALRLPGLREGARDGCGLLLTGRLAVNDLGAGTGRYREASRPRTKILT